MGKTRQKKYVLLYYLLFILYYVLFMYYIIIFL